LSFIPTRTFIYNSSILESSEELVRRIKLKAFFDKKNNKKGGAVVEPEKPEPFIEKSGWTPPDRYIDSKTWELTEKIRVATDKFITEQQLKGKYTQRNGRQVIHIGNKSNLTRAERECMFRLKNNNNIVIKSADKGGGHSNYE